MIKKAAFSFLPVPIRRWLGVAGSPPASTDIEVVDGEVSPTLLHGWQHADVAARQQAAFRSVLQELRRGIPREDFMALAQAVNRTQPDNPLVIEVGCASGWNSEVLALLTVRPCQYIGVDYSFAMVALGQQCYPSVRFITGDATALPFRDGACDVLLSGTVLMHLLNYQRAIAESRRVTRRWCIFHTVPVARGRPTTTLRKRAYGSPVVEIVFNEQELLDLFAANGLALRVTFPSIRHDYLNELLGEPIQAWTYLCEIR